MSVVELHIANNIEDLNALALKDVKRIRKFDQMCNGLEVLYKNAITEILDQEKAYIYLVRFFELYKRASKHIQDDKFLEARFHRELKSAQNQLQKISEDLKKRYAEKARGKASVSRVKISSKYTPIAKTSKTIFDNDFVSCRDLYSALNSKQPHNILLVDARPAEDFAQSKINIGQCINVPDHIISTGMSANRIGELLPPEVQGIWNQRDTFDVIVLLDWGTSSDTFPASKLDKLRSSLVDWDVRKQYEQKPVVLSGGYMEWLQMYPTMCSFPHAFLNKINNQLDELLNLDDIQYPADDSVQLLAFKQITEEESEENLDQSREALIEKNHELSMTSEKIINQLMDEERKWTELSNEKEMKNNQKLQELQDTIATLEKELEKVTREKNTVQDDFELYAKFDPNKESLGAEQITQMVDIDQKDSEKLKIRETISQQRLSELAKARALKPKASGEPRSSSANNVDRPTINRATKPSSRNVFEGQLSFGSSGLVGLKNLRNTCYQNTVVQCMRNVPALSSLFCMGHYKKQIRRKPEALIIETASLFRGLWSNIHSVYNPSNFYEKICALEPMYKAGNHEDCMEFFLFLLNHLNEDCAFDIARPEVMTPLQQAWCSQLCGKNSIFIELFYHQIRIKQNCYNCKAASIKFEIESTFMLPVPERDFNLEDLMHDYLKDYVIDDYCCSKCKKPVQNSKSVVHAPKILVIVLKRYKQEIRNGVASFNKIETKSTFPTKDFRFGNATYTLNSIAMHSGNMQVGHYTAACLTNHSWYEFNDETVRPINIFDDGVRSKACAFFYSKDE